MARTIERAARAAKVARQVCLAMAGVLAAGAALAQPAASGDAAGTAFVLPDGGSGAVGGKAPTFWLQLPGGRIEVRNATALAFRSVQQVGRDTLVVLVQSSDECRARLLLVAQAERGPLQSWDVGNCRALPATRVSPDGVAFEVEQDGRITRHLFAGGRLQASEVAVVPQPAVPATAAPLAAAADGAATADAPATVPGAAAERSAPAAKAGASRERGRPGPVRRPPKPSFEKPAMTKTIRID